MTALITGMGLFTPVGRGVEETFDALTTGRSGLTRPPEGHPVSTSLDVAGLLPDIDPRTVASGPETRVLDRVVVLALLAAADALTDAGIEVGRDVEPDRIGVIVGGVGGMATLESQVLARAARGRAAVSPYLLTGILPNMPAARIAIAHGIRGYSSSVGTACASGAQAVADGVRLIATGEVDVVLCGASEAPLFPTFADTFGNARALARAGTDPGRASRPFDTSRSGFVLSEGAALLVLERAEHAAARGVAGYAEVAGHGATTDAYHPTAPARTARARRRASAGRCAAPVCRRRRSVTSTRTAPARSSVTSRRPPRWLTSSASAVCRSAPPRRSPVTCSVPPGCWRRRPPRWRSVGGCCRRRTTSTIRIRPARRTTSVARPARPTWSTRSPTRSGSAART